MDRSQARRLIFASAAIGSLGTFAMHAILPALPDIRAQFATTVSTAQLLVTLSMLAIASGNVVVAPLSDRLGRRPVIFAGLSLFIVGSIAGMLANSIALLIGARIVQAFGSGAAMAVARATLMDAFGPGTRCERYRLHGDRHSRVPMVAPTIGGFAVELAGWRLVFGLCVVLGTAAILFTALRIQETHQTSAATRGGPDTLESYRQLLRTGRYRAYALFGSLLFAAVYVFIAGAPHVAIDVLHILPVALRPAVHAAGFSLVRRVLHCSTHLAAYRRAAHDARRLLPLAERRSVADDAGAVWRLASGGLVPAGDAGVLCKRDLGAQCDIERHWSAS